MKKRIVKLLKNVKLLFQYYLLPKAKKITPKNYDTGKVFVFIRSWNRPLYLWTCLDNLYRNTSKDVYFVLIDNASSNQLVKKVIKGFERREMFHAVHFMKQNHGANQQLVFAKYKKDMGKYFFLLDSDITIQSKEYHWDKVMIDVAERNPQLSLLGSYIDTSDFVDYDRAKQLYPEFNELQIAALIKKNSPERKIPPKFAEIINPFSPPGRLLLVKKSVVEKVGLPIGNTNLCKAVKAAGYQYGITTRITHRHLSLLNIFDYPEYDFQQLHNYLSGK